MEERGCFTEQEYRQGLALAQTMPGSLVAQLAMSFGFLQAGALGAAAVGVPFVFPAVPTGRDYFRPKMCAPSNRDASRATVVTPAAASWRRSGAC
jgi:hypothetical protein